MSVNVPLDFAFALGEDNGSVTGSSRGTQLTGSVSANTKGSFTQLIASTANDAVALIINLDGSPLSGSQASVDLAIGGAGSEVVVAGDMRIDFDGADLGNGSWIIPCGIPAGTRLSARMQGTTGSNHININAIGLRGDFIDGASGLDTYGFVSASTIGTSIDPGGSANNKGSWSEIATSLTNDISGFFLYFDGLNQSTSSVTCTELVDIGIGPAASEVVIVPNIQVTKRRTSTVVTATPQLIGPIWIPVPAGTRIAARAQCSVNTATTRLIGLTFYGIRL